MCADAVGGGSGLYTIDTSVGTGAHAAADRRFEGPSRA